MTALSAITIKGFKSISSVKGLPIRPINVLIGANGSGKSNFLGVFKLLQAIRQSLAGLQNYVARAGGAGPDSALRLQGDSEKVGRLTSRSETCSTASRSHHSTA